MSLTVEPLRPRDAAGAGATLAASHHSYPAFRYLFPDPRVRRRVLRPFMTGAARDAARLGQSQLARDEQGMVGVALWMPPGTFPLSPLRKARMTPSLLRAAIAAPHAFPAFARSGAALERAHISGRAWYLQALGVHPRAQGRGVGQRLMTRALELADAQRLPCHLHTSDPANVAFYQRFGFEVSQPKIRVTPHGPPYLGMSRPARTA